MSVNQLKSLKGVAMFTWHASYNRDCWSSSETSRSTGRSNFSAARVAEELGCRVWRVSMTLLFIVLQISIGCNGSSDGISSPPTPHIEPSVNEYIPTAGVDKVDRQTRISELLERIESEYYPEYPLTVLELLDMDPTGREVLPLLEERFSSDDCHVVQCAAQMLEHYERASIPLLIRMLDSNEQVKLRDTADLIYPGATTFYGHGLIINYDIDRLADRAGWVLEKITFEDFGFRMDQFQHDDLLAATAAGMADRPLDEVAGNKPGPVRTPGDARLAVTKAKRWWSEHRASWSRCDGLVDAISSRNPRREMEALQWLRFGDTRCDGLTLGRFGKTVYPQIEQLASSNDSAIKEQAILLLDSSLKSSWP